VALGAVSWAPGAGAFTMGSNLARDPDVSIQSTGSTQLTVFNPVLSAGLRVGGQSGTYFSPVDGTIVRWRIRTGDTDTGPVALRIIRGAVSPNITVARTGAGTSSTVTPALGAISTYDVQMRIHRGDAIGVDCCWPDLGQFFATSPDPAHEIAQLAIWGDPPLADGGPLRSVDDQDFLELAVNADIEPDSAFTVSAVKEVSKHRLRVSATFPNPGVLLAGDPRDPTVFGKPPPSVPSRPGFLFRAVSAGFGTRLGETAPCSASLLLRPTKRALKLLRRRGTLRGVIELAYTPAYGSVVARTAPFRLRMNGSKRR
jgi:hypothetical protein